MQKFLRDNGVETNISVMERVDMGFDAVVETLELLMGQYENLFEGLDPRNEIIQDNLFKADSDERRI